MNEKKRIDKENNDNLVSILMGISLILFLVVSILRLHNLFALPIFAFIGAICVFAIYIAKQEETARLAKEKVKQDTLKKAQETVDSVNATVAVLKQDDCILKTAKRFGSLNPQEFSRLCLISFIYLGFGKRVDIVDDACFSFVRNKEFVVRCLSTSKKITIKDIDDYIQDEQIAYKYNDGRKYILCSQGEISENAAKVAENKRIKVLCGDSFAYSLRLAYSKFCQYLDKYVEAKKLQLQLIDMDLAPYLPSKGKSFSHSLDFTKGDNWEEKLDILDDIIGD